MTNIAISSPYFVKKIWGGNKLSKIKRLENLELPLGESWEVSALSEGPSKIADKPLFEMVTKEQLPYLIKFIDTSDHLSVQVHPDDEYAKANENSMGKTECWIILEASPGAGIYLGFQEGVTKEKFEKAVNDQEDVSKYLNFYPVERGNFFYVPAGSVHAIGKDVMLAEVQQSSGITYRVWDWNRVDDKGVGRELHVRQAMDVLNFDKKENSLEHFKFSKNIFETNSQELINHPDFKVQSLCLKTGESIELPANQKRIVSVVCLKGSCNVSCEDDSLDVSEFSSAVNMESNNITLRATADCEVLIIR